MLLPRQEYEAALAEVKALGRTLPESDPRYRRVLHESQRDALLTVPHGAPGNDAIAPPVAMAAHEAALGLGLDVGLVMSVCDRYSIVDMNRPQSRKTDFRGAVRREILWKRPKVLVDVHSFPNRYDVYSGIDMVLIHTPGVTDESFLKRYAALLKIAAELSGKKGARIEVQRQHQPVIHDIILEARELGMPADAVMLVEHNEGGPNGLGNASLYGRLHAMAIRALTGKK